MTISIEESDKLFSECYEYKSIILSTKSEDDFNKARTNLIDLASNLRSSSGRFTPTLGFATDDRTVIEKHLRFIKQKQDEAKSLHLWATRMRFVKPEQKSEV